jgi:hypothetical protein
MKIPNYDAKNCDSNGYTQINSNMPNKPFRMLICGPSGSGKTNLLMHTLTKPLVYYDHLYVYAKNLDQDKFQGLIRQLNCIAKKIKHEFAFFSNNDILPIDNLDNDLQKVVVFDDYIVDKNQKDIVDYFIRGRTKNCSVVYLSQTYFKTPKDIRLNCSQFAIYNFPSKREINNILYDHPEVTLEMYKKATASSYSFIYIDKMSNKVTKNIDENII